MMQQCTGEKMVLGENWSHASIILIYLHYIFEKILTLSYASPPQKMIHTLFCNNHNISVVYFDKPNCYTIGTVHTGTSSHYMYQYCRLNITV